MLEVASKALILIKLGYTRKIYLKSLRRAILQKFANKVTNKGKPRMSSFACKLTIEFLPVKILLKKVCGNILFSTREIALKKVHGNNVDFSTIEITTKKHLEKCGYFNHQN